MQRVFDSILVFCGVCSISILRNMPLGCFFVFIILVKQIIEYKKEHSKENGFAVCLYALTLIFLLTFSCFGFSKKIGIIGALLNPVAVIAFIVFFAFSVVILVAKRKKLSITQKTVFGIICVVCLAYFVFILWATIGFGNSHPAHDPIPYSPTSK